MAHEPADENADPRRVEETDLGQVEHESTVTTKVGCRFYRGEDRPHVCKHVRGLLSLGRKPGEACSPRETAAPKGPDPTSTPSPRVSLPLTPAPRLFDAPIATNVGIASLTAMPTPLSRTVTDLPA